MLERLPAQAGLSDHLRGLDALRGLLAIVVVFAHGWQIFIAPVHPPAPALPWWVIGRGLAAEAAVMSFFTLSGFVIALSAERNIARHGSFSMADFAQARAFRILSPLLFVLLLTYVIQAGLGWVGYASAPADLPLARPDYRQLFFPTIKCILSACANGTLVRDVNGPLWSLEAEVQLYVISGLLVWFSCSKRHRWIIGLALLAYLLLSFRPVRDGVLTLQPASFAAYGLGWLMQRVGTRLPVWSCVTVIAVGLVGAGTLLAGMPAEQFLHLNGGTRVSLVFVLYAAASAAAINLFAGKSAPDWAAKLGSFSYTLYIVHFPLLLAGSFFIANSSGEFARAYAVPLGIGAPLVVIAIAAVIGPLIERPRAQRKFAARQWDRARLLWSHAAPPEAPSSSGSRLGARGLPSRSSRDGTALPAHCGDGSPQ